MWQALDGRAESALSVRKPKHDLEPPLWLKYGLGIVIPVMYVLSFAVSAKVGHSAGYAVTAALLDALSQQRLLS
ncbi:MAG: hypothetical protein NVS3B26_08070 [Mycobacteriales bacterium]